MVQFDHLALVCGRRPMSNLRNELQARTREWSHLALLHRGHKVLALALRFPHNFNVPPQTVLKTRFASLQETLGCHGLLSRSLGPVKRRC